MRSCNHFFIASECGIWFVILPAAVLRLARTKFYSKRAAHTRLSKYRLSPRSGNRKEIVSKIFATSATNVIKAFVRAQSTDSMPSPQRKVKEDAPWPRTMRVSFHSSLAVFANKTGKCSVGLEDDLGALFCNYGEANVVGKTPCQHWMKSSGSHFKRFFRFAGATLPSASGLNGSKFSALAKAGHFCCLRWIIDFSIRGRTHDECSESRNHIVQFKATRTKWWMQKYTKENQRTFPSQQFNKQPGLWQIYFDRLRQQPPASEC